MPERKGRAPKTAERLGRMLVIVPYLVQHPGSELSDVARAFDVPVDQLRRDLDLLFMSGLPPYGPGDLIEVDVDEDDRIWISMAEQFARPLRISRSEALALYLRGMELLGTAGVPEAPALRSAMDKLRTSLGPETLGDAGGIETADPGAPIEALDPIRDASRERQRVQVDYFAHSSGEWSSRVIEPEQVFAALGHWYVAAWDVTIDARATVPRRSYPARGGDGRTVRAARSRGRGAFAVHPHRGRRPRASPAGSGGPLDRRVLRDHGRARGDRRVAGHHDARAVPGVGRQAACCGWGAMRPCWSHPN